MMHAVIAIDGPSGAGKGTVARAVAAALGYRHVDTGAMYRAVAWRALQLGLDLEDEEAVLRVSREAVFDLDGSRVSIDGADVSAAIRTAEIDKAVTPVARQARVRAELVARQRAMAEDGPVVMEGRDIGTVVFPEAPLKIYLDALPEERARRRAHDPAHAASATQAHDEIARAMARRDDCDRTRQASPLSVAPDALVIDTTHLSVAEVVERVMAAAARARVVAEGPLAVRGRRRS